MSIKPLVIFTTVNGYLAGRGQGQCQHEVQRLNMPLQLAAMEGSIEAVTMLIERGAETNSIVDCNGIPLDRAQP